MPYWWEKYSEVPDDNNSAPPDGAPEGHFPDQVNNIQRQAMAAIREAFALIFKPTALAGPITTLPTDALADAFRQQIYDDQWPVGSIRAWRGGAGNPLVPPDGITAVWQICDGQNASLNLARALIAGADTANASPVYSGDVDGSNTTSSDGGHTPSGAVEPHHLSVPELPIHTPVININDPGHSHNQSPATGREGSTGGVTCQQTSVGAGALTSTEFTGITATAEPIGSDQAHDHSLMMNDVPDHTHTVNPEKTFLEFYERVA